MDFYNALIAQKENSSITQVETEDGKVQTISGTGEIQLEEISLINTKDEKIEYIAVGEEVTLNVKVKVNESVPQMVVGYMIKDRLGQPIFGTNTHHYKQVIENPKEGSKIEFDFGFCMNLGVGSYSVTIAIHADDTHLSSNYEWQDQALVFNVVNTSKEEFVGSSWLKQKVEVKYVN